MTAAIFKKDLTVICLVGLAHASSHFGHLMLPAMFPVFKKEFGLSYSALGLLMSTFFVVSGVGQVFAGFMVDRWGARPLMFIALALFAVASVLAAAATGYSSLIAVAALAGLANATFHPVDFTILNQRVSSARLGYGFSAHGLSGNLGWAAAPVFFATCGGLWGWRNAYLAAAALYVLVFLLLLVFRAHLHTTTLVRQTQSTVTAHRSFVRLPVVWWCFVFFLLSTITLAVIQGYSVSILKAMHGISFESATLTLTAYMLCGAVGMLWGGYIATRPMQSDRVVSVAMLIAAILLALCGTGWLDATLTMVVLAATGFAVGVGGPSRDMMIKKATPAAATGRVYGLVYSGLDIGFAISPLLFGPMLDRGWYSATLWGAALVLLLSVFAALGVGRRTHPASHE